MSCLEVRKDCEEICELINAVSHQVMKPQG